MVDARNRELEDRRKRDLNLTMFNLPGPNKENSAAKKQADEQDFKIICRRLGLEEVNVMSSFRLDRMPECKIRPIKLILRDKSHRKFIIEKKTRSKEGTNTVAVSRHYQRHHTITKKREKGKVRAKKTATSTPTVRDK